MPSRFDLATNKVPRKMSNKEIEDSIKVISEEPIRQRTRPVTARRSENFLSRLKIVNEVTGAELPLSEADFSLSVAAAADGPAATIAISFTCSGEEAERLFQGGRHR